MSSIFRSPLATRSLPGARRAFLGTLVGAALVAGAAQAAEPTGPLPWRVGGRVGFTVDAAAFPESANTRLEVYLRITPGTVTSLVRDAAGERHLKLTARLKGAFGASQRSASEEFAIAPGDTATGFGKVVVLSFPTRPGPQELHVRLEDVFARKRGIAYMGRNVKEGSDVEGDFDVPAIQSGRSLSSLEFAWAEDSSVTSGAFAGRGPHIVPNPERLFGLYANELRAFFVARDAGERRDWSWRARILDPAGRIVAARETTVAAAAELRGRYVADVTREPAGGYDLEVAVWHPGDRDTLTRRAHWGVAWQPESWFRNPRVLEDHMHFLLSTDGEEHFVLMNPGEQEAFVDHFWQVRDPSPGTGRNEAHEEFLRRIALANRAYSHAASVPGMFSDMGRTFIRYGEPSEVLKQVVPSGDNTLTRVLQELQLSEDRDVGEVRQKGLGGDMRPYEVWVYEGEIPLPMDADPTVEKSTRHKRLVFLFVDEQGTGDYRLRYSTE